MESLHVDTTQIRNKWDCWKSSAQSKRRYLSCIVAIRSKWKLVGRFYVLLHLSAQRHRSIIWWEDALWKTFWATFYRTGHSVRFIGWVSPHNCEGSVKFGKKVLPGMFLGYALYAGEFGRVTYWLQTLRSWRRWTHRKSTRKDSMRKRWYFPKKKENLFSNRRWTNQTPWRRSRPGNIHLDTAAISSRRKSLWFSWRIRRVSSTTSRLISGCWWSD